MKTRRLISCLISMLYMGSISASSQEAERISKLSPAEIKPRLVQLALELFERRKMDDCIRPHDSVALRIWFKAEYVEDEDHALKDPRGYESERLYYVIELHEKEPSEDSRGFCFISFDDKGQPIMVLPYTYPHFPDFYIFQPDFFKGKSRPLTPGADSNKREKKKGMNGEIDWLEDSY